MNQIIRKKCLSIVLTLAMVMSLFPAVTMPAKAAYTPPTPLAVIWGGGDQSATCHDEGDYINSVSFAGVTNNSGTAAGWHTDYGRTNPQVAVMEVQKGQTLPIQVAVEGRDFSWHYLAVYIDWNGDGNNGDGTTMDYGEEVAVWNGYTGSGTIIKTANISVPTDAVTGYVYLRVMLDADTSGGAGDYTCGVGYGEFEDYVLNISAAGPTVTGVNPTGGSTAGGTSVTITGTNFTGATAVSFGGTPATSFTVNSATQITATSPAHAAGTVDITVTTADGTSATGAADKFIYAVPNAAPTNIALSATSVNENVIANTTVGTLSTTDPDAGNTFTYSLVSGTGDTDNASFNISGTNLRITNSPDFETKSSYSVRVRTTDQGGLTYEEAFTITINDLNETPTDISLSSSSVNENVAGNTTVGTLSSTDPDAANTFTYSLVAGTGSTDNASFNISGSSLRISNSPDYETKNSYSVRVRTTDQGSLFFEKAITISINNINEPPSDITLTATSINQSGGANAVVGTLGTIDVDNADSFTYTLVSGDGDTNNSSFNISGSTLRATDARALAAGTYSVRVRTTDSGSLTYEKAFTITVTDNVAPMVSTVSVPANDTYKAGQNLDFTVNFNENATVDTLGGTPYITVVIGGMNRQLAYT